jgi:type I restriction enzyme S subunit
MLGDLAAEEVGAIAIGPFGSRMKADTYVREGVPVIRGTNISAGRGLKGDWVFVSENFARSIPNCIAREGDLVFPHRGSIGEVALVERHQTPLVISSSMMKFRPNTAKVDVRFLLYFFKSPAGRSEILRFSSQVGTPGIGQPLTSLRQFRVPLPTLSVQSEIADVLSALDDKIEINRQMNYTLETACLAIFRDWFTDFGPTLAKLGGRAPYLAEEIWSLFPARLDEGGRPEGWNAESVYDQAIWVNGAAYKDMHFSSEPDALPVVKIAELKNGITNTTRFTNTDLGDRYKIRNGELLFSWSGNPDTSIDTFIWTSGTAWLNQHIFAVRPNGKRSQAFLYAMLKFLRSEFAEIARNKQTTGLGHVTQQDLIRLKITAPGEGAQLAFDELVGPLHSRFISNLFENQSLAATRDFLAPRLMSGEVRVKDAEKIVGEAT